MSVTTELLKMVIEVGVFAVVIYVVLRFLRQTRGAGVVRGLSVILLLALGAFTFLIKALELRHLEFVFTALAGTTVLGLVIVFQPEIRRAIVQLGESPLFARFRREPHTVPRLLRGVARLSKDRLGALIAVERDVSLAELTASGLMIDAEVNSYLVESIFAKASPLHDGAIIVRDNRIVAAKCVLPLSESPNIDQRLGTRHRAAVGLTEESDALAVVVSEETGKISFARHGVLQHDVTLEELEQAMDSDTAGVPATAPAADRFALRRWAVDPWRKLVSALLAFSLWFWLDGQISEKTWRECRLDLAQPGQINSDEPTIGSALDILVPLREYTQIAFRDADDGHLIQAVTLHFDGPKGLIERIRAHERSWVEPTPSQLGDDGIFEFEASDLQFRNDDFRQALRSMEPPRVKVELARNGSSDLRLSLDYVRIRAPDANVDDTFAARLDPKSAHFYPETVTLRGTTELLGQVTKTAQQLRNPEHHLGAQDAFLFDLDLTGFANTTQRELKQPLHLRLQWQQQGLQLEQAAVEVVIPLRPEFKKFSLEVPVQLINTATALRPADFVAPAVARVTLLAASTLDAELQGKAEPELRGWIQQNLVVLAALPENASVERDVNLEGFLVFLKNHDLQLGVDYRAEVELLTLKPKKP